MHGMIFKTTIPFQHPFRSNFFTMQSYLNLLCTERPYMESNFDIFNEIRKLKKKIVSDCIYLYWTDLDNFNE